MIYNNYWRNQIKLIHIKNWGWCVLSILQAAIDRRVLINAVDINGKFKINGVSNDILKVQKWMVQHYTMI